MKIKVWIESDGTCGGQLVKYPAVISQGKDTAQLYLNLLDALDMYLMGGNERKISYIYETLRFKQRTGDWGNPPHGA